MPSSTLKRLLLAALACVVFAAVVAACGGGGSDTTSGGETSEEAAGGEEEAGGGEEASGEGNIKIALMLPENETPRYETNDKPDFEKAVEEQCSGCEIKYFNAGGDAEKQQS